MGGGGGEGQELRGGEPSRVGIPFWPDGVEECDLECRLLSSARATLPTPVLMTTTEVSHSCFPEVR
jgi:hypothetical protein